MRWLWYSKTDPGRPWQGLDVPTHKNACALFAVSVVTRVGNGTDTLFWSDRWLHGCSIQDLAPQVVACVPPKVVRSLTVAEALYHNSWPRDVGGALSAEGYIELYLGVPV